MAITSPGRSYVRAYVPGPDAGTPKLLILTDTRDMEEVATLQMR